MISKDTRHLWTLAGVLAAGAIGAVAARQLLVPASYGTLGPFRADHMREEAARAATVTTTAECVECHEGVGKMSAEGPHKSVHCMNCHGVGRAHAERCRAAAAGSGAETCEGPAAVTADLHSEKSAAECMRCHRKMVGRPAEHKQVAPVRHAEKKGSEEPDGPAVCAECHLSHDPSQAPEEQAAVDPEASAG